MTINFSNNSIPQNLALLSMHVMGSMAVLAWNFNSEHLKQLLACCAGVVLIAELSEKEPGLSRVNYATSLLGEAARGCVVGLASLVITAMSCSKHHLDRIGANTPEKRKAEIAKSFIVMDTILTILSVVPFKELSSQLQR